MHFRAFWGYAVLLLALVAGRPHAENYQDEGLASWYGGKFHGRLTANGEVFNTYELTAAHKTLPFGTLVKVTSLRTGKSVTVRINDRGPFVGGRIIDLSKAAADAIGLTAAGVDRVRLEAFADSPPAPSAQPEDQDPGRPVIIQIASFREPANAQTLKEFLEGAGLSPSLEVTAAGVHRVVLASVPRMEVDEVKKRLKTLGFDNVLVRLSGS